MRFLLGLVTIAGLASNAAADATLVCDMAGSFREAKEDFRFTAGYVVKNGPDTFTGVYANPSYGARADVQGAATNGTWSIRLTYIDAQHKGWTKELTGPGRRDDKSNELKVDGTYTAKTGGAVTGKGTFTLRGKCRYVRRI